MKELVRYHMVFAGRVQGVGFRYKANYVADQYRLTGYVRNEYDGSVTVEIQGSEQEIYMFLKSLANDRYIDIYEVQKERIPVEEDERGFIVQYQWRMEIGLTTSVQNKISSLRLEQSQESDYRFWWEVNLTKLGNRNTIVIVHPSSRYCMVYSNLKASVWKNLNSFVSDAIRDALFREGFSIDDVKHYFEMAGDIVYTKTHGRQATGGMNRITGDLWFFEDSLDRECMYQEYISQRINDSPSTNGLHPDYTCIFPQDYFVNEMNNLLFGEKMRLRFATKKGNITIRDGKVV